MNADILGVRSVIVGGRDAGCATFGVDPSFGVTDSRLQPEEAAVPLRILGMKMAFGAPENSTQPTKDVSRRTLMKTAAWTVPVIAFAAPVPAYAASPCSPSTNFDGLTPNPNVIVNTIYFYNSLNQQTGVSASIAYASNNQGNDQTPGGTGTVEATNTNPSWNYIEIEMLERLVKDQYVTLTITFNQPVSGLSFTIHDIDKVRSGSDVAWVDHVQVSGSLNANAVAFTAANGTNVLGNGSVGNPFRPDAWGDNPINSGLNRTTVSFTGLVNQVVIRYLAGENGYSGNQHVGLGNLSYNICAPAAPTSKQARSLAAPLATEPRLLPEETDGFAGADGAIDGTVDS